MRERIKISFSTLWLFLSLTTLLAPIFVPSVPGSNVIGYATVAMVLLSFPSSMIAAPMMIFVSMALGIHTHTIEGMYLNLAILFGLGVAQWYWIIPKIWGDGPQVQTLGIETNFPTEAFSRAIPKDLFSPFDPEGRTPVERIIVENSVSDEPN